MREDIKTLILPCLVVRKDLIIYPHYLYALHSVINEHIYKLYFISSWSEVNYIPSIDYDLIETRYQYLKLKYG